MENLTTEVKELEGDAEWPEPEEGNDDTDPMFDSTRSYLDQCDRFELHQGEPTEGKVAAKARVKKARAEERRARSAAMRAGVAA
jgi:hypothetical protein